MVQHRKNLLILVAAIALAVLPGCRRGGSERASAGGSAGAPLSTLPAAPAAVDLAVAPSQSALAVGATLTVDVVLASQAADLYGAAFDLSYDPRVLEFQSAQQTSRFLSGAKSYFEFKNGQPGTLVVGISKEGAVPGDAGQGPLARFVFVAKGAGRTSLALGDVALLTSQAVQVPVNPVAAPVIDVR